MSSWFKCVRIIEASLKTVGQGVMEESMYVSIDRSTGFPDLYRNLTVLEILCKTLQVYMLRISKDKSW